MSATKKKYKLLLINPLSTKSLGLMRDQKSIYPPMSLGIIAALTPEHWEIELLDENFERFEFREADLIGITELTAQVTRAYEIAAIYREKNISTVMGGIQVSVMPEEAMQMADVVVKSEAKSVWETWERLYEEKQLKKKFIQALKLTRNAVAATWSYSSNIHYHNLTFEHYWDHTTLKDEFA